MPTFIDLSHDIHDGMVTYPGLPAAELTTVLSREDSRGRYAPGVEFHIGSATLCTNTGTYLDTPAHRYEDGWDLTGLPLERCAELPAVVVDMPDGAGGRPFGFGADHFADLSLAGTAVLLRTGWSDHWGTTPTAPPTTRTSPPPAPRRWSRPGVALVGIDSLNIDSTVGNDRPAHSGLLAAGIPIVEHLTGARRAAPHRGALHRGADQGGRPRHVRGASLRHHRRPPVVAEVVFDGHDVARLARFWAEITGGTARVRTDEWATVAPSRPDGWCSPSSGCPSRRR